MINNRDKKYLKAFGKRLQQKREEKNLSKTTLANAANMGRNQIGKFERGELNPTICTLKALAEILETTPQDLLNF